ncbi:hypothetical protein IW262DRAFT_1467628 [Armillaria fumosa]|nr:hypothetical protein IW262DRAFT_1467628 [Armillaria fumosa]
MPLDRLLHVTELCAASTASASASGHTFQRFLVRSETFLGGKILHAADLIRTSFSLEDYNYIDPSSCRGTSFQVTIFLQIDGIAYRDLFLTKFVTEWCPNRTKTIMFTGPRVYIIDFETAVRFSEDDTERVTGTFPVSVRSWYRRPLVLELETPDCTFRLDVWQISNDILRFKVTFFLHLHVISGIHVDDSAKRLTIQEALDKMAKCVKSILESDLMAMRKLDNDDDIS